MSETPGPSSPSDPIPSSRGRSMTAPTPTSGSGSGSGSSDRSTSHAPAQGLASDAALSSLINMQSPPGRLYDDLAHNPDFGMSVSAGYDFLDQHMAGSGLDYPGMHAGFMDYDLPSEPDGGGMEGEREREMEREPAGSPSASCNCVSRLVEELGSLPSLSSSSSSTPNNGGIPGSSGGGGGGASFDAQLSQLRRAINVSADCLSCHCNTQDEMSISMSTMLQLRLSMLPRALLNDRVQ
ncbi:uncharacterized protein BJX67DRAFT_366817 [Aspergillus lucknowensis]|uniref:Uncharacterized protein n=1 Tax=Aspergillus lucknowensis TaxID=176173 RepID=A0ABR4LCE4_9EURO